MPLLIVDECIACDACREECPMDAIEEGDPIYIIDPEDYFLLNVSVPMMNLHVSPYVLLIVLSRTKITSKRCKNFSINTSN